ncbi:hypothetical protein BH23PLA1_BH23PLA1_22310 [soil metagenome]
MRSRAHYKGHPIHPMLIVFPTAFLIGALVCDLAALAVDWAEGGRIGAYLGIAGIVTGLIAGVPGLIDYLTIIPPNSSAKWRGTQHMAVNLAALAAFALGWLFRDFPSLMPGIGTVLLEVVGVALLTSGGWMGGTLVYRNQIGVDHRHSHAGKWNEQSFEVRPGEPVVVAEADELKSGQMKLLHIGDRRIVLGRSDDGYVAFDDHCSHKGGSLADGTLICETVDCPWHGSRFNVRTGAVEAGPAEESIATYRVELADGKVRLTL